MLPSLKLNKLLVLISLTFFVVLFNSASFGADQAYDRGIYLTQNSLERTDFLQYHIKRAKETGINTFIIDLIKPRPIYQNNIQLVKAAGIKYVARLVVFPGGGDAEQVASIAYREKVNTLIQEALAAGADAIQLDYIRYNTKMTPSPQNAQNILAVIKWFRERIPAQIPLQIDIFGITSYQASDRIGQDVKVFAGTVSAVNPMVYPSHYWPFAEHSKQPYKTILESLDSLYAQFANKPPFDVHAFIEASNYHYKGMTNAEVQKYMLAQIRAVEDAGGVQGWYVWSAKNKYENLFKVLENNSIRKHYVAKKPFDPTQKHHRATVAKATPEATSAAEISQEITQNAASAQQPIAATPTETEAANTDINTTDPTNVTATPAEANPTTDTTPAIAPNT